MAKYLISFPSAAMVVPDGEWEAVGRDAHAVIDEAKAAGVYVFGGEGRGGNVACQGCPWSRASAVLILATSGPASAPS